jgi:Putative cyclase
MPRGSSPKRERQYEHIRASARKRGGFSPACSPAIRWPTWSCRWPTRCRAPGPGTCHSGRPYGAGSPPGRTPRSRCTPHTGGSYQTRWLVIDEHTGTHIDAPRYFVPPPASGLPHAGQARDIGVDSLPVAAMGAADVIDVSGLTPTAAHSALL